MKKIISIILALVFVLACMALVSCAKDEENKGGGDKPVETDHDHPLLTAGLDFEGEEIRIVVASNNLARDSIAAISVDVDEKTGETLVDSVYDRNATVERTLGVDIQLIDVFPHSGFTNSVKDVLISGTDEYDIFFAQQAGDINLCRQEYIINLHDLEPYGNPKCYIQEDQDWWAHNYMEYYTYKDELYWLSSNLSMTYTGGAMCSMVNLEMYNRLFAEQHGSIYDVVKQGKWTVDLMTQMCSVVFNDADSSDSVTSGDTFGWYSGGSSFYKMAILVGVGVEVTSKNQDGSLNFLISNTNNEFITRSQRVYNLFNETVGVTSSETAGKFTDGVTLFNVCTLNDLRGTAIREMSADFAVIPTPKFNEQQAAYRVAMHDNNHLIGLPYTNTEKIEACTATLELMAYLSYYDVFPEYLNEALKYKYSRDEETAEMIQLIYDSVYTDFGLIWERWIWNALWLRNGGIAKNPASTIMKSQDTWNETFKEILADLDRLSAGS